MTHTHYAIVRKSDGKSCAVSGQTIVWLTTVNKDPGFRHTKAQVKKILPRLTDEVDVLERQWESRPGPGIF